MRRVWMVVLVVFFFFSAQLGAAPGPSLEEILDKFDDVYRGKSSKGLMVMKVVTEHFKREMKMEYTSKGKDQFLVKILLPKKSKGIATLKSGNNIWNYLPKIKRTIKVPSSMMGGSWMGSHFSNNDLVKQNRMADDYDSAITFRGKKGEVEVIEITSIPKENAAIVWGKVLLRIRKLDLMPLKVFYFKEDMSLARVMTYSDFKSVAGRLTPMKMKVVPSNKKGEMTEVSFANLQFDINISDKTFSLANLQK